MNDSVYAVVAYIARYWFALLAVIIIWRAIVWVRADMNRTSREQRKLPDAGYIGEWAVVASDAPDIAAGEVMRAPRDGWIGSARGCDVQLCKAGVPARVARFYLQEDGLHVLPQRKGTVLVDGEAVQHEAVMRHGATLTVGGVTLQLRLFAGVRLTGEQPAFGHRRRKKGKKAVILKEDDWFDLDEAEEGDVDFVKDGEEQKGAAEAKTELPRPNLKVPAQKRRR